MSKKRKTRKQKEAASIRHEEHIHAVLQTPVYTIPDVKVKKEVAYTTKRKNVQVQTLNISEVAYLKKDIMSITIASGVIIAFDILLVVLLNSGGLKLNLFGY